MILPAPSLSQQRPNADPYSSARQSRARPARVLCLIVIWLIFFSLNAAAQQPPKRVLVLTGSDPNHPGFSIITTNTLSTLREGYPSRVEMIYDLQEGLFREPDSPQRDQELADYLRRKYNDRNVDVILALVAPRLRLLIEKDPSLLANVPKVFYDYDSEREVTNRTLGPNITGIWASLDLYKTLDLAFLMQPDARKVVVVAGEGPGEQLKKELAVKQYRPYENRAQFEYLTSGTVDELKARLAALPKDSFVVWLGFSRDRMGNNYTSPEALSLIAPASSAPLYGFTDTQMGWGIIGGNLLNFNAIGSRIGRLSLRVLNGEKPEQIPQETAPTVMTVDWRQLQRFGISEANLPPGSVVKFKELSYWESYKWYIVGLLAAVIIEALLIAWLLALRRRGKQAENEKQRLAQLAQTEHKRLDEIVSNVPGVVWEAAIDPESKQRRTTFISDYLQKMLGYSPEEWLAAAPGFGLKIMPEEDRDRALRETEAVLDSGTEGVSQFRWITKDGRTVWAESHLTPVSDESGEVVGLRGVTLDVTERKLAEEMVRRTEEKDRAILHAIPDLMFVQTMDGVYLDYHAKHAKDLLAPPDQFLGKNMFDILPRELAETFLKSFQLAAKSNGNGPQIVEYKLRINDTDKWFEARLVRAGENILSVVRDITERRERLAELHASEERFGKAFRANPQPMSITTFADGRYLDVNDSFLAMSGYTREEVIGKTSLELGIWDSPEARADFLQGLAENGSVVNVETKFHIKDGSLRVLLSSAELLEIGGEKCLLVASSDITERMKAEEALRESEERFRNMAETAPVMIWVSDPDKQTTYFNQQWLDFTGRNMAEETGFGWEKGVHPDDREHVWETYGTAFDRREKFTLECRVRRADGIYRWIFAAGTPRISPTGEFLGYIGSCLDITDRKEAEETLRQAHEAVSRLKTQFEEENIYLREEIKLERHFVELVGKSDELKYVLFKIEQVAPTDSTVLITGETGTGKELVARAIHGASLRKDRALVKVNCAALSASLIESELFGHEKGAFTGAMTRKIGRFELADGATLFLDEIGELPMELQVKLLRVIQEGEFERLGSSKTIKVDVRIIAATNRNLSKAVAEGRFREDLWYRLNVFPITLPPLRQRQEDIPLLVEHFVRRFSKAMGKQVTSVSPSTLNVLHDYSWPGNVRELANVIERGVINSRGSVLQISDRLENAVTEQERASTLTLEQMERDYITRILEERGWRIEGRNGAARLLGINPSTLRTRMNKLGIQKPLSLTASGRTER